MYVISPAPPGRRTEVRGQPRDEAVQAAAGGALRAAGGARKDGGRREAGDVDVARRRRDREVLRSVGVCAAEVRGLVERGEVGAQARDDRVGASAGRALGAADGAREVRGVRLPREVYVARRASNGAGNRA